MGKQSKITRRRALLAGGGTAVFGGGVAYVASRSESEGQEYVPSEFHTSDGTSGFGVELAGRPLVGARDAPVDIYYWTDYLCPFCKKFETETLPAIGEEYVENGTVRVVVLAYPNIGQYSMPAAMWGRSVWNRVAESDPTAFWNWHTAVFDAQAESGNDWADEETFTSITERVDGVDRAAVEEYRASNEGFVRETVDVDYEAARSVGLQGTPAFVLYNRESGAAGTIVGAQPYDGFADAIEQVREA